MEDKDAPEAHSVEPAGSDEHVVKTSSGESVVLKGVAALTALGVSLATEASPAHGADSPDQPQSLTLYFKVPANVTVRTNVVTVASDIDVSSVSFATERGFDLTSAKTVTWLNGELPLQHVGVTGLSKAAGCACCVRG